MKILELNTWTTADVILYLIRLYAPRHTKSFWEEVYLPCIRDGDGSLMQQRAGGWCRRWKIGLDRRSCASKLLFYAFDSYWKECVLHHMLSPEEARFIAGIQGVQMHHFRWAIQLVLGGQRTTGIAASPGPMFGRRGKKPEDYKKVSPKAVRLAVRYVLILIPFQDETNNATLSSWQDHEEPMSSWSHPLGRLCSKPRTSGNSGKPWRCCSQRS